MDGYEFVVQVKPRELIKQADGRGGYPSIDVVYDIYVRDVANDNLLVFSNQGYENRQDAVDIANKLFDGRPALLEVYDGDGFREFTDRLETGAV